MRQYWSGVSQSMIAGLLCLILAPILQRYLPGTVFDLSLGAILSTLMWGCGLAAIVVSFLQLRRLRIQIVRLLDSRCAELMASDQNIRNAHPSYQGSLASSNYLPTGTPDEMARAALHRFNGRLKDFLDDLELAKSIRRLEIRPPNPTGTLSDVGQALGDVHQKFQLWLF